MSQPIAIVASSFSSLCGRELLVYAFPEYEVLIRSFSGLIAGIGVFHLSQPQDVALWGFGVCAVMDLLITENVIWTAMPIMGWLLASAGFEGSERLTPEVSRRRVKKNDTRIENKTEVPRHRPGTLHAHFHEIPERFEPLPSESQVIMAGILPLTSANVRRMTQSPLYFDTEKTQEDDSLDDDFHIPRSASSHTHEPIESPISELHRMLNSAPVELQLNQEELEPVEPEVNSEAGTVKARSEPAQDEDLTERHLTPPLLLRIEPEEIVAPETRSDIEEIEDVQADIPPPLIDTLVEDLISETGSLSTTVRSCEVGGTCAQLCRLAEGFRQQGQSARKRAVTLELQRQVALRMGNGGEAFSLKFNIRDIEKEAERADRKAARLFYRARNVQRPSWLIDVHYLKKEEALKVTEKGLRAVQLRGGRELQVIVGKGLHSRGHKPVLKPYIKDNMRDQGIEAEEDPFNSGVLIIKLT